MISFRKPRRLSRPNFYQLWVVFPMAVCVFIMLLQDAMKEEPLIDGALNED